MICYSHVKRKDYDLHMGQLKGVRDNGNYMNTSLLLVGICVI